MSRVDPYTQRFPTNVPLLDQSGRMSKEWVDWFNYDNLWKQQIWQRTGGGSDAVADTDIGFIQGIFGEKEDFSFVSVSSNRTTSGNEFLRVTAECTITLNTAPDDDEEVIVQPTGFFPVTISGSINGDTELIMRGAYDLAHLIYRSELAEWVVS